MSRTTGAGVIVLGMHRSGTSATTRAINLLGVPLAREEELIPPSRNNPTGFWEVSRLTEFNNRLLSSLGGSSLGPPVLAEGWVADASLERLRGRGKRLFAAAHDAQSWAWKDPRNCITLPFWREALDARAVVVLVHRDPLAIARSLDARQGLSTAMALAAWERYLRSALANVRGLPVLLTPYPDLVEAPERWADEVGGFLGDHGLPAGAAGSGERLRELVEARPERGGPQAAAEPYTPAIALSEPQRRLVAAIESLVGRHDDFPPVELPGETDWTEPLLAERRRAEVMRQQMDERMRSLRRRMRAAQEARERAEEALESAGGGRTGAVRRLFPQRSRGDGADRGALPDFLIIGAQKAGTSSLFRWLGESPGVELPEAKEVHFFDLQFDRGVDWYRDQFPAPASRARGRGKALTGEASPYYLFHPLAPERIKEVVPEVRLLALVRDPVDRAVSHYYHELGNGFEDLPLAIALDREEERLSGEAERLRAEPGYVSHNHRHFSYQTRGVYADQLALWRSVFPAEQLLVSNSDRFFENPRREMRRVHEFLELPGKPAASLSAYNQRNYPSVPSETSERLAAHFSDHNARLENLLGEELGWQEAPAR
jgi:hypothetical protein